MKNNTKQQARSDYEKKQENLKHQCVHNENCAWKFSPLMWVCAVYSNIHMMMVEIPTFFFLSSCLLLEPNKSLVVKSIKMILLVLVKKLKRRGESKRHPSIKNSYTALLWRSFPLPTPNCSLFDNKCFCGHNFRKERS